jgi:hypothetical protein
MMEPSRPGVFMAFYNRITDPFAAWIARLSPRERLLLGSMALIALVLAPIKAFDLSQNATGRLADAQSRLETAKVGSGRSSVMFERRVVAQGKEVQRWSWPEPSIPIAQVVLQQQLTTLAVEAKLQDLEVKATDEVPIAGGVRFVRMDVSARFDWLALTDFLKRVANLGKGVVLTSIATEGEGTVKVRMLLDLPVALGAPVVGAKRRPPLAVAPAAVTAAPVL